MILTGRYFQVAAHGLRISIGGLKIQSFCAAASTLVELQAGLIERILNKIELKVFLLPIREERRQLF